MDLIKIENNKEHGLVVSSRVVAEELGKDIQDVKKKIRELLESGTEYFPVQIAVRGRQAEDYLVNKNGFILLVMNYQGYNEFKRVYINKFNEMEKKLQELHIPKSLPEALRAYADAVEEKEKQKLLTIEKQKTIDMLVHENKLYNTTEVAKELGLKSAIALNKLLGEKKVQFRSNGTWVLYADYANLGYVSIKQNVLDCGKIVYDRKWTGEGRKFLLEKFQNLKSA
jgi:Rha family phage regulatory protein